MLNPKTAWVWAIVLLYCVDAQAQEFAKATDVHIREAYRAQERPGHCCWVSLWHDPDDGVYLSFVEKYRRDNPLWKPIPLNFWESMGLPRGMHTTIGNGAKDIAYQIVVLKSSDQGESWRETGRCLSELDNSFSWVSLKDGSLLRSQSNDYVAWRKAERQQTWCEISTDGGKTWAKRATIFYGHNGSGSPHRLRRLHDGTLVQLISAMPEFGPGKERFGRHTKRSHVRQELSVFLYFSRDEGRTWSGPLVVLPAVMAWEPDFVELPSGDLLVLNSRVQQGPQVRQYVRKTDLGWMPGPVYDVASGQVPETVACTKAGILVGAVRNGGYTCSNDDGANWYPVANIPNAGYQPSLVELSNGQFLCAMHVGGGDEAFDEHDPYISTASFKLVANLPQPTRVTLNRDLNPAGDQYINSYTAALTCGDKPIANKTIRFQYERRDGRDKELTATTDQQGLARLDLREDFQSVTDIHLSYTLKARFVPDSGDRDLASCESDRYFAYVITSSAGDLGHTKAP